MLSSITNFQLSRREYLQMIFLSVPTLALFILNSITYILFSKVDNNLISYFLLNSGFIFVPIMILAAWQINELFINIKNPNDYLRYSKMISLIITSLILLISLITFVMPDNGYLIELYMLTFGNFLIFSFERYLVPKEVKKTYKRKVHAAALA